MKTKIKIIFKFTATLRSSIGHQNSFPSGRGLHVLRKPYCRGNALQGEVTGHAPECTETELQDAGHRGDCDAQTAPASVQTWDR